MAKLLDVWLHHDIYVFSFNRVELCLQQNEIMDIFPDDYLLLANDDGIVANTSDTNLKVSFSYFQTCNILFL